MNSSPGGTGRLVVTRNRKGCGRAGGRAGRPAVHCSQQAASQAHLVVHCCSTRARRWLDRGGRQPHAWQHRSVLLPSRGPPQSCAAVDLQTCSALGVQHEACMAMGHREQTSGGTDLSFLARAPSGSHPAKDERLHHGAICGLGLAQALHPGSRLAKWVTTHVAAGDASTRSAP